jgi:hypothetical protein
MTDLIACLSSDKAENNHVKKVIEMENWGNIYLIADKQLDFQCDKKVNMIIIDSKKITTELASDIRGKLKGKIAGTQVGLNLISGTGKLHMAVISAILGLGLGLRLIVLTPNGIEEL